MSSLRCEQVASSSSQTHSKKLALGPANLCRTGCPFPTQEQTTAALEKPQPRALRHSLLLAFLCAPALSRSWTRL